MRNLYYRFNDYTGLVEVYTDEKYLMPVDGLRNGDYSAIAFRFSGSDFAYMCHEYDSSLLQDIIDELAELPIAEVFNVPVIKLKGVSLRVLLIELQRISSDL